MRMRAIAFCLALLTFTAASATVLHGDSRPRPIDDRAAVVAALEQLMLTGEPRHSDHDEGQWLQRAVDDAFRRKDTEIVLLAQRASVTLVPKVSRPVAPVTDPPAFYVETVKMLKLPRPVPYTAEVFASLDGGELVRLDGWQQSNVVGSFWDAGRRPGLHHVRLQARITYEGAEGTVPAPERRNLRELVYAIYHPADTQYDARIFLLAPAGVSARQFDSALPDVPFAEWLNGVLGPHQSSSNPHQDWLTTYCDERVVEAGSSPKTAAICSVAYFGAAGVIGQIWIRTGRVELADGEVRWLVEAPQFEAVRLMSPDATESGALSTLPALLAQPPATWPRGDVTVTPEDVTVTPGRGSVRVEATVRNMGDADLRGVLIYIAASTSGERGDSLSFVRDIPRGGDARVECTLMLPAAYGTVLVHAMQLSEHNPTESWAADATPDDAVAFRVVNGKRAPKDYAQWVRNECGFICRGY
jgi:hypothetical protein